MTEKKKKKDYCYDLIQNGIMVARVISRNKEDCLREIGHYAMMYFQDGEVKIIKRR